jgi:hypothetical protein
VVWLTYHEVLTTISRGSSRRAPLARRKRSAARRHYLGRLSDLEPRGPPARRVAKARLGCPADGQSVEAYA